MIVAAGCTPTEKPELTAINPAVLNEYFINAALYNYFTAEYKALSYQAFNSASNYIEILRLKNPNRKDMAIVLDIDETLLDNSPYQAKLYEINSSYDTLWNEWCNLAQARPIPGSVEFLQFADSLGYNIYYISNRKLKYVYKSTFENMKTVGFPQVDSMHLILRSEGNSKEKRRLLVGENNEIVMLVGDNIGDFYEDSRNYSIRDSTVISHKKEFGGKLIVLPNAMYGNWVESLGIENKSDIDSLISIMTKPFGN
jgi:5'-nucleotidase (lipoprotein e(P4) family)